MRKLRLTPQNSKYKYQERDGRSADDSIVEENYAQWYQPAIVTFVTLLSAFMYYMDYSKSLNVRIRQESEVSSKN